MGQFLLTNDLPTDVGDHGRHLAAYQADQLERFSPNTAALRHRTLKVFFNWLVLEGEIDSSPMANLPSLVDEVEVPVIPVEDIRKLLSVCAGSNFEDRRDAAIIRVLLPGTGLRVSELTGLRVEDVELANRLLHVMGKGRKGRSVRYGVQTAPAMNRYLRERAKHHPGSDLDPSGGSDPEAP